MAEQSHHDAVNQSLSADAPASVDASASNPTDSAARAAGDKPPSTAQDPSNVQLYHTGSEHPTHPPDAAQHQTSAASQLGVGQATCRCAHKSDCSRI